MDYLRTGCMTETEKRRLCPRRVPGTRKFQTAQETRMRGVAKAGLSLALMVGMATVRADDVQWRPAGQTDAAPPARGFKLLPPVPLTNLAPLTPTSLTEVERGAPASALGARRSALPPGGEEPRPIIRAQNAELQPPVPGVPPVPPPPYTGGAGADEAYHCGQAGAKGGGFFGRCWEGCKEWWFGIPDHAKGIFQPGPRRGLFQSDHDYDDKIISPVTNPFYFEDPRALTEVRPIFMWQQTPGNNYIFAGGDNVFAGLQARLAITERFSIVVNQLGFIWMEPHSSVNPEFASHVGFAEFHIGPKVTIIRQECFLAAAGFTFEIPTGPAKVFQDTGSLSLDPYISMGFSFGETFKAGSFALLNTTGYSVSTNDLRGDFFHTSFHLSFDVAHLHRVYPLLELHWLHYTSNGHTRDLGFEGRDLFHFGSLGAAGHDELTLAGGLRFKVNDLIQFGVGAEFSLLGGGRHLDDFRLTADMIIRY